MRFRGTAPPADSIPFGTALLTWLPIAGGIIAGTLVRSVALVFHSGPLIALLASLVCTGVGVALAVVWLTASSPTEDWQGVLRVSLCWALLTIVFRAVWLGTLVGGGWVGVRLDYRIGQGQPGIPIVLLIAAAPLLLHWWHPPEDAEERPPER